MGRLRWLVGKLKRDASEHLDSFPLADGDVYYYDRMEAMRDLYLYCYDSELGGEPEPPTIWLKLLEARDPEDVLSRFRSSDPASAFVHLDTLYYEQVEGT